MSEIVNLQVYPGFERQLVLSAAIVAALQGKPVPPEVPEVHPQLLLQLVLVLLKIVSEQVGPLALHVIFALVKSHGMVGDKVLSVTVFETGQRQEL